MSAMVTTFVRLIQVSLDIGHYASCLPLGLLLSLAIPEIRAQKSHVSPNARRSSPREVTDVLRLRQIPLTRAETVFDIRTLL